MCGSALTKLIKACAYRGIGSDHIDLQAAIDRALPLRR